MVFESALSHCLYHLVCMRCLGLIVQFEKKQESSSRILVDTLKTCTFTHWKIKVKLPKRLQGNHSVGKLCLWGWCFVQINGFSKKCWLHLLVWQRAACSVQVQPTTLLTGRQMRLLQRMYLTYIESVIYLESNYLAWAPAIDFYLNNILANLLSKSLS